MDLYPWLSYIKLWNAQDIESAEIIVGHRRHDIPKRGRGIFSLRFKDALMLPKQKLTLSIVRMTSRFGFSSQTISQLISIRSIEILSKFWGQSTIGNPCRFITSETQTGAQKKGGKVSITLGVLSVTFGIVLRPKQVGSMEEIVPLMRPTTKGPIRVVHQVPRFRLLIVGKVSSICVPHSSRFHQRVSLQSGVGKYTLLNRVFGVETAYVAMDRPGADIEQEFTSPHDDRLVFHDSKGFDGENYETVLSFIERRKRMPDIKDQLHAVWLCFQIPILTHGERLLEDAAQAFLRIRKVLLGNTPTIIVFTKYDRLVTYMRAKKIRNSGDEQQYLREYCINPIRDFTGDMDIAHVAVSSKPKYEQTLKELISLTQAKVTSSFTCPENQVSAVALAAAGAQRMLPTLKIDLSIEVGKQRYWRVLGSSTNSPGHTMQDCLRGLHTDIVLVWNFYDPCQYLDSENFRTLMMNMVGTVDATTESTHHRSRSGTLDGSVLFFHPALAPVILPIYAGLSLVKWVYEIHRRQQDVSRQFMAYIVDLTHVLEILFSLTADMRAKKLTRTAIKLAYKVYYRSEWMAYAHTDIRSFQCSSTARDVVLEKITSMLSSDDREARVSGAIEGMLARMPSVDLEKDEEWADQEVSQ
ncbi:hypothetical protein EDC04DRAFT_3108985 [Pisolithus marmoratus]|nr:hypothetical protein EDC04DRAFT_3108985 [Pisolithus marmoratus]